MSLSIDISALLPYAPLALRMLLVGLFVVTIAIVAERMGPFIGGMIASLPLYTGPIYLLLAIEHGAAYLEAASIGSLAITGATAVFALGYCVLARTNGVLVSLAGAYAAWLVCAAIIQFGDFGLVEALLFVVPIYSVSVPLARGFTRGIAVPKARRGWLDLPLRAVLVAVLSGIVVTLSQYLNARVTGILSVMPILLTSLIMVLHVRIGGPATAALIAFTLDGLVGMVIAFVWLHLTIVQMGAAVSLGIALAITVGWNVMLILIRNWKRKRLAVPLASPPSAPPPTWPARR